MTSMMRSGTKITLASGGGAKGSAICSRLALEGAGGGKTIASVPCGSLVEIAGARAIG